MWRAVLAGYVLAKHELVLLESACRMADHVAALDAQVAADGLVVQGRLDLEQRSQARSVIVGEAKAGWDGRGSDR